MCVGILDRLSHPADNPQNMPRAKSNLLTAAEWLWSNQKKGLWWAPEVLTSSNKDPSAPKLSSVEARSIFKILEERGLIFPAVQDGRPIYHLHEAKEREWADFLSELKSEGLNEKDKADVSFGRTKEQAPDITEPKKFAWHQISTNWHHLRAASLAVASIVVIAFVSGFLLAWNMVVASKDATIETLKTAKEIEDKENEKLRGQVVDLRAYRAQDAMPLKKKALILVQQIREFMAGWKDTDAGNVQSDNVQKYLNRFGLRAQIMRDDLDQNGQHSDVFDKVIYDFSANYHDVRTIATEIERLGKNLPD